MAVSNIDLKEQIICLTERVSELASEVHELTQTVARLSVEMYHHGF